jgi:hypothetical protein
MSSVDSLERQELQQIVWEQMGIRVSNQSTRKQLHDLLCYRLDEEDLPDNSVNAKRGEIMQFIEDHRNQLSIPCSGKCYEHSDGVVLTCYLQLKEDISGSETETD